MKAVSYRITEDCRLESVPPEQVGDAWKADDAAYWLDIQGSGEDALEHYLRGVEVNQIIVQLFKDTKDTGSIARVIPTEDQVFFNLPVHTGGDHDTVGHLGALCLPRLLVTFHEQPVDSLDTLATVLQHTTLLRTSTTSALVCLMLMQLSSQSNQVAERVSRRVIHLAAQMDRDANVIKMEQILAEKANLRALEAVDEESSPVYGLLKITNSEALNLTGLESYFQVVLGNTDFLTRNVYRLSSRLADLYQRYVVNAQDKMNQRLTALTIISAIFLPLTLLSGIYGMNFEDMPELHLRYAYPALLGIMAAIAFGLWRYFKRNGWFD